MLTDDWHGAYRQGWGKNRLRPASFAHPAKVSYGLSVRIYEHALEQSWVKPGDYLVDIFAGIGGFALEAMRHGLNFVGVELEQRFVDMGQGCDCTGISKADWVRFQGRWGKARYKDGRHWCPECIMRAGTVANEREFKVAAKRKIKPLPLPGTKWGALVKARQATLFDLPAQASAAPTASYVRNSGVIPCTGAHHYRGNVETWAAQGMPGTAVIVQGDSRRLGEVLERASLCLSSPPYADTPTNDAQRHSRHRVGDGAMDGPVAYGQTEGNLGNLPDTGFEACLCYGRQACLRRQACERLAIAISSPPWQEVGSLDDPSFFRKHREEIGRDPDAPGGTPGYYGQADGQLGQMPPGDHAAALEAQVEMGRAQCAISSPPYEASVSSGRDGIDFAKAGRPDKMVKTGRMHYPIGARADRDFRYGSTTGQLGQETGSTFWAASKQILEQVYQVLAPGAHAIWVLKMFVRSGRLVDFPGQWEALCQSVGFKTVCKHCAWMNRNTGIVQTTLDGDEVSMELWYKSFFRLICERKGSPRIDWELVLCMEKPNQEAK